MITPRNPRDGNAVITELCQTDGAPAKLYLGGEKLLAILQTCSEGLVTVRTKGPEQILLVSDGWEDEFLLAGMGKPEEEKC